MTPTPARLREVIEAEFPPSATCWSQATDEVRDMAWLARETLGLDDSHAVDFLKLNTPALHNSVGTMAVIVWYTAMTGEQRTQYINALRGYIPDMVDSMCQGIAISLAEAKEILSDMNNGTVDAISPSKGGRAWLSGEWMLDELEALCVVVRHEAGANAEGAMEMLAHWEASK